MDKSRYDLVDVVKFVLSILIVALHCSALYQFGPEANTWLCDLPSRLGVPFFFMASSYLLFSRNGGAPLTKEGLVRYIKRIGLLYLFWFCFNLPHTLYVLLVTNPFSLASLLAFFKDAIFSGTYLGSWYLGCSIWSVLVVYLLSKWLSTGKILVISFLLYVVCIMTCVYSGWMSEDAYHTLTTYFVAPRNSVFAGLFYFTMGKWIAEHKEKLFGYRRRWYALFFVIFAALGVLEVYLVRGWLGDPVSLACFFMLVPTSICLFLFVITSKARIAHASTLRHLSTITYCSHPFIIAVARHAFPLFGIETLSVSVLYCLSALAATWVLGFVIMALSRRRGFTWLKIAY